METGRDDLAWPSVMSLYPLMVSFDFRIQSVVLIFGLFISGSMYLIMRWNAANHRADPSLDRLIGEVKH